MIAKKKKNVRFGKQWTKAKEKHANKNITAYQAGNAYINMMAKPSYGGQQQELKRLYIRGKRFLPLHSQIQVNKP